MNQYGESDLVNNPRYQGQSGGTDLRGPEGESRYGAMPMSTGTGQGYGAPREGMVDRAKDAVGMGPNSGAQGYDNYGNPRREGIVDKAKDAVGIGPNSGYDNRRDEPEYGNQGYGQPREGMVDRAKDTVGMGPNSGAQSYDNYGNPRREGMVDRAKDAVGVGPNSGYDNRRDEPGYGNQGYGQPREGVVDRTKDAVGMGPNSGYDNRRDEPGYGTQGYGQPREGMVDRAKDAVGMGPNSGNDNRRDQPGYDNYGNPQREGVVDKMKDAVGMGPNSGRPYNASQEYNPNVNHSSEERGFGGGLGHPHGTNTGYDQSQNLGSGYDNRMATGADAYGQPRRAGVVDKMKDVAGVGPNSGYDDRTRTGIDAYVHGNHPGGMQDRITGVNEPTMLEGRYGVQGVGHPDGALGVGEHVPENVLGERRTEPGYDMSKGHISDHLPGHKTGHGTRLGHHDTDYDETRGKGFEDTTGANTTKTGTGGDYYDETNTGTGTGYDDTDVHHHSGTAPPKKGLMTKIKEKLPGHHNH